MRDRISKTATKEIGAVGRDALETKKGTS